MNTEADRYTFIQERSGLSKKDFAESLGITKEQGSMISRGRYKPSRDVLNALARRYQVDLTWFLSGEGCPEAGPGGASIELIDQAAAAGRGQEIQDYPERRMIQVPPELIAPHRAASLRAVFVAGDSMEGEAINDKDIVIYRPSQAEGNGLYVLSIGNTLLVKRVEFDDLKNTVILISANPAYSPREVSGPDLASFRIEGRVVACLHRF